MVFTYQGSGLAEIIGCANYTVTIFPIFSYPVGSVVYSRPKAVKGIYEKVVIKAIRLPKFYANAASFGMAKYASLAPLYVDTLNALWNEEDLVSYSEATVLIAHWQIRQGNIAENALRRC